MFVIFYVLFCMIACLAGIAFGYWIRSKELEPLVKAYRRLINVHYNHGEEEKSE